MSPYLIYLDDYHLGDPLFLQGLARALARTRADTPPAAIVHGSGEVAERMLEAQGWFVERQGGLLPVETSEQAAIIERAIRHVNRTLVGLLTESIVAAVGTTGNERRFFEIDAGGELVLGPTGWVEELMARRVVPVIGAWARLRGADRAGEVPASAVLKGLVKSFGGATIVVFTKTNLPGLMNGAEVRASVPLSEVPERVLPVARAVLDELLTTGATLLLTNTGRLRDGKVPEGTRLTEE